MENLKVKSIGWCAVLGVLGLALAACVWRGELGPRHLPSGHPIPMPSADFGAYVTAVKVTIVAANRARGWSLTADVVADRAPFELAPDPRRCPAAADGHHAKAALLIHSLGGTPYEMQDLARAFAEACYLVRAILLPGHGTVPGDLLDVDYGEWIEATRRAVASFDGAAERLILVGSSLGATLAIHEALFDAPPPGLELVGLVLLAPALGTEPAPTWLLAPRAYGALGAEGRWSRVLSDSDPVRYESLPRNAGLQQARLVDQLDGQEAPLGLPTFMAISADDPEVEPTPARNWFCQQLSGPRRLVWYTVAPALTSDCPFVVERSSAASSNIIGFSDFALPISPADPRYGADADYLDCAPYYWEKDSPIWFVCMDPTNTPADSQVRYGAINETNLQGHIMRRLTYNPDFQVMVEDMLAFLANPG